MINTDVYPAMRAEWVIGSYTGEQAKSVKAHADAGIGYFFQRSAGVGPNYTVMAAFRRPCDSPRADHLQLATPEQVVKLEALLARRNGIKEDRRDEPAMGGMYHPGIAQSMYDAIPVGDR